MTARGLPDLKGGNILTGADAEIGHHTGEKCSRGPMAMQMIDRLQALGDPMADRHANKILACIENRIRCKDLFHASCQVRRSKKEQRSINQILRDLSSETYVGILTMTVGADDVTEGLDALGSSFAKLRRHREFIFDGGRGRIEIVAAVGAGRRWNVHMHLACWHTAPICPRVLRGAWREHVASHGLPGNLDRRGSQTRAARFSGVAYYVGKVRGAEWLSLSDEMLLQLVHALPGRRLALRFGRPSPAT
jgi:hypothetical protein